MSESLFYACFFLTALFGLYHIFEGIYKYFMCKKNQDGIYTIIYHTEDEELLADKVYSALLLTGYKTFGNREVYVIDNSFSRHTKLKCSLLAGDLGKVQFINSDELCFLYKIKADND